MASNDCKRLVAQIDAGECSESELSLIPDIDDCNINDTISWSDSVEWLKRSKQAANPGEQVDSKEILEWVAQFRQRKRVHPHRPAANDAERATCMACDFVCTGSLNTPTSSKRSMMLSRAVGLTQIGVTSLGAFLQLWL